MPKYTPMNKIIEGIYLGDIRAATNLDLLKSHGITHILQALGGVKPSFEGQFKYKVLQVNDVPWENLGRHFMDAAQFIKNSLAEGGRVFVHCWAGISRSTSCICAYLMMEHQISLQASLNICRQGRHIINPNPGFIKQLMDFQLKLKKMRQSSHDNSGANKTMQPAMHKTSKSVSNTNVNNAARGQSHHDMRRSYPGKDVAVEGGKQPGRSTNQISSSNIYDGQSQVGLAGQLSSTLKQPAGARNDNNFEIGDVPRGYFRSSGGAQPKQDSPQKQQQLQGMHSQPQNQNTVKDRTVNIIEQAKQHGLHSLSNQQKLHILQEANRAKHSRIKDIGARGNPYKTYSGATPAGNSRKWSHYMDNRYNDKANPTHGGARRDASGPDRRQEMVQQRAYSGKPTSNTQYGSFYPKNNPSQPPAKPTGAGNLPNSGSLASKYQIYGSFDNRGGQNAGNRAQRADQAAVARKGALQIPAINRGMLPPALNY